MKKRDYYLLVPVAAAFFFCLHCSPVKTAGNGSDIGNPMVVGMLYEPDGQTPAVNATVNVRKRNSLLDTSATGPSINVKTVTTNDSGNYSIDSVPDGLYIIEAAKDTDAVLIDSVTVNAKDKKRLGPDTLKPTGKIIGVIKLSEGGDPRKVFIQAYDIDRFGMVNADGSFTFAKLAKGKYHLRFTPALQDYGVLEMEGVGVGVDSVTALDTVEMPFTGIPTPKNVSIAYDTMKQIVTLRWRKADTAIVKAFNVFRRKTTDGQFVVANKSPLADTFFTDGLSNGIEKGLSYEYYVVALDKNNNAGPNSSSISATIAFYVDAGRDTMFQVGDTVLLTGRVDTSAVTPEEYMWDVNGDGTLDFVSGTEMSVKYVYADTGLYKAVFSVKTANNSIYSDTVIVKVNAKAAGILPSPPRNFAVSYDTVNQYAILRWTPNAESNVKGYLVYRKNIDSNTVLTKINTVIIQDTVFYDSSFVQVSNFEYQVSAIDNSGNEGIKSQSKTVLTRAPFVLATASGGFRGRYGAACVEFNNMIWLIGGATGGNNTEVYLNDVWYSADGISWTKATDSAGFEPRRWLAGVVLNGKIWVIGGYEKTKNGSYIEHSDVWNSTDGVNWTKIADTTGFEPRENMTAVEYDNKMWIVSGGDKSDVWYSVDGITWIETTNSAPFSARYGHSLVSFNGKIWVIGGMDRYGAKNDAWYSSDGKNWSLAIDTAGFSIRYFASGLNFSGQMWIIAGYGGSWNPVCQRDMWSSMDGMQWTRRARFTGFPDRSGQLGIATANRLMIIAGYIVNNSDYGNDVWFLK